MRRQSIPELMDDPGADRAELGAALGFIRRVNERLGGQAALIRHLERWSAAWPTDRPITLLDIATGSADLPVAAVRWARQRGFDLRVTAIDNHATTLEFAREHVGDGSGVELELLDVSALNERFEAGAFDYVHAGLFLHHMPNDVKIMTVLKQMDRLARRGVVWNDLVRSRAGYAFIWAATVGKAEMVRHDARVSVLAGFTKREAVDLVRRTGLDYLRHDWNLFTHRFTMAGERSGAWNG